MLPPPIALAAVAALHASFALPQEEDDLERRATAAAGQLDALTELADEIADDGDHDGALWLLQAAAALAPGSREAKAIRSQWGKALAATELELGDPLDFVNEAADDVFKLGDLMAKKRLYANAADVFQMCMGTSAEEKAQKALDRLIGKEKSLEAILRSGIPVHFERPRKLRPETIAIEDPKHTEWEDAWEFESDNYRVLTNVGYEMAQDVLDAMEQMNQFYRTVFETGKRGNQKTKTCTVRVFKNHDEFVAYEPDHAENALAYYWVVDNSVTAYDLSTDPNYDIQEFWATLFHEASHQFTAMVTALHMPAWLNEGTASYFEGARILPGGFVETNRVVDYYLREVVRMIGPRPSGDETTTQRGASASGPTLKSVISYFEPGSYEADYYPFGWGLVYFCRNYENDAGERIYRPIYEAFMASYKRNGERNAFQRFVDYFVTEPAFEDVPDFEAFERRWKHWIWDLADVHFGGPEGADTLVARGRNQIEHGFVENAIESFSWATEKNPRNVTAWMELGHACAASEREDRAMYAYRRALALARRHPVPDEEEAPELPHWDGTTEEASADALEAIAEVDANIERLFRKLITEISAGAREMSAAYEDAYYPRTALALLRSTESLLGGDGVLRSRIHVLSEDSEIDGRIAEPLPLSSDLEEHWLTYDEGWSTDGESLTFGSPGGSLGSIFVREQPGLVYRVEATVDMEKGTVPGIAFGETEWTETYFLTYPGKRRSTLVEYDPHPRRMAERAAESGQPASPFILIEAFEKSPGRLAMDFDIALEVEHTQVRLFADERLVGTWEVPAEEVLGRVGFVAAGKATFKDLVIRR